VKEENVNGLGDPNLDMVQLVHDFFTSCINFGHMQSFNLNIDMLVSCKTTNITVKQSRCHSHSKEAYLPPIPHFFAPLCTCQVAVGNGKPVTNPG
jgi:hypothetical protein